MNEASILGTTHGATPGMVAILPFVGLLLAIAVLPLIPRTARWWEHNRNRLIVSLSFAAMTIGYYVIAHGGSKALQVGEHAILGEYIPFIVVLFALYVISGGISLGGDRPAHPLTNTGLLALGTVLASLIGTTGASMLLIREVLQTNRERKHVTHTVIFFIFLVSNVGGSLLPIGDPPLFLGYLQGVPFFWTLSLWKEWLILSTVLLSVYYVWDTLMYRREELRDLVRDEAEVTRLRLRGGLNLVWLAAVVLTVAVIKPGEVLPMVGIKTFPFLRELILLGLVGVSLGWTNPKIRIENGFKYHAILEVAALFIGIFLCMQPALEILDHRRLELQQIVGTPARLFWATGGLSGFLDNAPTYLVFLRLACTDGLTNVTDISLRDGLFVDQGKLTALSLGAVFFGAMTYIGNGPNFMVNSIAEQQGVRMPSFFGYLLYSVCILVPVFLVLTAFFF
ncbi:MAG: sodium:proton antiporter [Planctomycetota bacterium]